jgi:hypothetical protein
MLYGRDGKLMRSVAAGLPSRHMTEAPEAKYLPRAVGAIKRGLGGLLLRTTQGEGAWFFILI